MEPPRYVNRTSGGVRARGGQPPRLLDAGAGLLASHGFDGTSGRVHVQRPHRREPLTPHGDRHVCTQRAAVRVQRNSMQPR